MFKATFDAKLMKMKSQGKKLVLMGKLNDWVEKFVEGQECKEFVAKSGCQKEKNNLKKELLDVAEKFIKERHHKNEQRQLCELKEYMQPKVNYQKKINYLDSKIENDVEFFDDHAIPDEFLKLKIKLRKIKASK